MKKMKMGTSDFTQDNLEALQKLFPNIVAEGIDDDGNIYRSINLEQFESEFSNLINDEKQEKYQISWPGKRQSHFYANSPSNKTLRPLSDESINFPTTKNIFIEGDNLEVLKLLQETYLNKIKLIYIDPPYNTGKDFVYKDSYKVKSEDYLKESHQVDDKSGRLIANVESNGRFHSDWLSMMYPRLRLSRNLLRDDGVIFISIDDNEIANLKKITDEIFGEQNFVAQVVWEKMYTTKNDSSLISQCHEYILIYAKNIELEPINLLPRTAEMDARYTNPDNDPRGSWKAIPLYAKGERKNGRYPVTSPSTGKVHYPAQDSHWLYSEKDTNEMIKDGRISFGKDGNSLPNVKRFLTEVQQGAKAKTLWKHGEVGSNDSAKRELKPLYEPSAIPFDFPKPLTLIERIISLSCTPGQDNIVLDFFAGSGTSGHAVMLNQLAGGSSRFILVQIPQEIDEGKKEHLIASEYCKNKSLKLNLSELAKDRLRLAGKVIHKQIGAQNVDVGFRVFKVDESNMSEVFYNPDALSQDLLSSQADNVKRDRTPADLLFQVLLDWGVDISLPIEIKKLLGKDIFFVDGNALAACFDDSGSIDEALVKEIAKYSPLRVVFRDSGFKNDSMKINAEQVFKALSPASEIRTI